ncbi:uncharacterized protein LOC119270280 isoform X2 [Triticum dicoccoides]|uniref:uncharacterized protein LOC119270280 isoform X2 n=1 Tax=Triticum dicoccoides TaxID=85692 RepID=UPI0018903F22|nr:uncharacterized protein LOC119270280 isoform X2 [Triticum dicoccoides]XP_037408173.1 uncharacterized protein LOC119270280 isoform X2 [Triticum dicoccoides]
MDVLLLGALPMLLLARTGPGLAAQGTWCVPCGAAFAAAAVVVSRVSRQPMGREGLRLEVPARQLTDALNGSDFLKEKEVRKGMGATSLNRRVKEVEPEEVQGRIMVACGWLVQGNFRAGAAARVPEQAPRHWRSVGRILETKVKEERPPTRRCGVGRRGRPAGRPQCGAGRRGNRPARRRCDAGIQAAVQGGDMTAELRLGRWRGKAGSGARDTIRSDFLFLRVG